MQDHSGNRKDSNMDTPTVLEPRSQVDAPVQPVNPTVAPLPEVREVAEAILADCSIAAAEFLQEVRVTGGAE